jgi:hypothetical protein
MLPADNMFLTVLLNSFPDISYMSENMGREEKLFNWVEKHLLLTASILIAGAMIVGGIIVAFGNNTAEPPQPRPPIPAPPYPPPVPPYPPAPEPYPIPKPID